MHILESVSFKTVRHILMLPFVFIKAHMFWRGIHQGLSLKTSCLRTAGWTSHSHGTQKWKHFRSFEVVIGLVELYRISGRRVCRVLLPGNKDAVTPNPLTKEESRRVYKCDDECLSGSTTRWIFKSMWNI